MIEIEFEDDEGTKLAREVSLGPDWVDAYFALDDDGRDAHHRVYPARRIREIRTRKQESIKRN